MGGEKASAPFAIAFTAWSQPTQKKRTRRTTAKRRYSFMGDSCRLNCTPSRTGGGHAFGRTHAWIAEGLDGLAAVARRSRPPPPRPGRAADLAPLAGDRHPPPPARDPRGAQHRPRG